MKLHSPNSSGGHGDTSNSMVFVIQSQTKPGTEHHVDWVRSTCSCQSFLQEGISWCKHLSAVQIISERDQNAWIDDDSAIEGTSIPLPQLSIDSSLPTASWDPSPTTSTSSLPDLEADCFNSPNASLLELEDQGDEGVAHTDDASTRMKLWLAIVPMLQSATSINTSMLPSGMEVNDLRKFHDTLWRITDSNRPNGTHASKLPPVLRLPPNVKTSTETAAVMPPIKRKRETQHSDPYSAGEKAGKKVKGKHNPPKPLPTLSTLSASLSRPTVLPTAA
jgi:hypothetical protein